MTNAIDIALGVWGGLLLFTLTIVAYIGAAGFVAKLRSCRRVTGYSYLDQLRDRIKVML